MFAETSDNSQHSNRLIPESESFTFISSHENLGYEYELSCKVLET
jgi:hypothetical protein